MAEAINKREKKVTRMRKYLIETTEDLMQKEGFQSVTLRKIADETGYNSATIYNYFKDLNELVLYSSVRFLKKYNKELSQSLDDSMNAMEHYICIFRIFCQHTFSCPEIYYNMFYGKHGKNLGNILSDYYSMFPNELGTHTPAVANMLACGDIFERELFITRPIYEGGMASEEDVQRLVDLAIWSHEYLLHELCENKDTITIARQSKRYEDNILYLLRKMKLPGSPSVAALNE